MSSSSTQTSGYVRKERLCHPKTHQSFLFWLLIDHTNSSRTLGQFSLDSNHSSHAEHHRRVIMPAHSWSHIRTVTVRDCFFSPTYSPNVESILWENSAVLGLHPRRLLESRIYIATGKFSCIEIIMAVFEISLPLVGLPRTKTSQMTNEGNGMKEPDL